MRLRIVLQTENERAVPLSHQHFITAAIYHYLDQADQDYARFLHDHGYAATDDPADKRRFKFFCFSGLRSAKRRISGTQLVLGPGPVEWLVASPLEKFLKEFATGLLGGGTLRLGCEVFPIATVETLPPLRFSSPMKFKCLTSIVAGVPAQHNGRLAVKYLRPGDEEFSERIRANLLKKHQALYGRPPESPKFQLRWDEEYLKRNRGTKLVDFKGINIPGAFCPFELEGSVELMELGYDAGFGEKNAGGFGMVEGLNVNNGA